MKDDNYDIVDRISELVDEQLTHERSGYDHNVNQELCALCGTGWHGLEHTNGCPGAFADKKQIAEWKAGNPVPIGETSETVGGLLPLLDIIIRAFGNMFGVSIPAGSALDQFAQTLLESFDEMNIDVDSLPKDEQQEIRELLEGLRHHASGEAA